MTRKQALLKALELLDKNKDIEVINKITEILNELPLINWTKDTIFDTLNQWVIDNGRNPTTTNLKKKGLPPHPVIKFRFNMTAMEFLNMYYPQPIKLCNSKVYYMKTKEYWCNDFIKQYQIIKPTSAEEYNCKRNKNTPSWQCVANICEVKKWYDFLRLNTLEINYGERISLKIENIRIISYNNLLDELELVNQNILKNGIGLK